MIFFQKNAFEVIKLIDINLNCNTNWYINYARFNLKTGNVTLSKHHIALWLHNMDT